MGALLPTSVATSLVNYRSLIRRRWQRSWVGPAVPIVDESVPQGPNESNPVRSAGLAFLKSYPSRLVRHSQDATFALRATARPQREGRATAGRRRNGTIAQCWQSQSHVRDQNPSISIVPCGTAVSFCFIPSTSYWGYFQMSLAGQFPCAYHDTLG